MSSELVARFRNDTAPRLLAKFGNGGVRTTIQVIVQPVDPLLPPTVTKTYADIDAYVSGVSSRILSADPNLAASDLQVISAAVSYTPDVGDIVNVNSQDRRVVRVDSIPAAGDPAVYRFFLR